MSAVLNSNKAGFGAAVLDRAGICVSALCLVQCLALPLLIVITPLVSLGFFGSGTFHLMLLAVILPLSVVAFGLGYRRHRNASMLVPGGAGLAVLALAASLEIAASVNPWSVALITSLGGLLLIVGHWVNIRLHRRAGVTPCGD